MDEQDNEQVEQVENEPVEAGVGDQGPQVADGTPGFNPDAPAPISPPDSSDQSGEGFTPPEGEQQATPHSEGSATDPERTDALGIDRPEGEGDPETAPESAPEDAQPGQDSDPDGE